MVSSQSVEVKIGAESLEERLNNRLKILSQLKDPRRKELRWLKGLLKLKRRNALLEHIYEDLNYYLRNSPECFPYSCVEALDDLILKLIERESLEEKPTSRHPQVAVVKGHYYFSLPPIRYFTDGVEYACYSLIFLGRSFRLFNLKVNGSAPPSIDFIADLDGKELTFTFEKPHYNGNGSEKNGSGQNKKDAAEKDEAKKGEAKRIEAGHKCDNDYQSRIEKVKKKYLLDNYPFSSYFKKHTFENSVGVAIKRTDKQGSFSLTKTEVGLGYQNAHKYVIVFFGDTENYYFDLSGEMLFERLTVAETREKMRLAKACDIEEETKEFNPRRYSKELMKKLRQRWVHNPERFSLPGLEYIICGELETITNIADLVSMEHIQRRKRKHGFFVKDHFTGRKVKVRFAGTRVIIYGRDSGRDSGRDGETNSNEYNGINNNEYGRANNNDSNELLNAYRFNETIHVTYLTKTDVSNLGIVSICTLGNGQQSWKRNGLIRTIGDKRYIFSLRELSERYGKPVESVKYVGIMTNNITNQYVVLLKEENGEFTSLPATPRIVASPRYAKRLVKSSF